MVSGGTGVGSGVGVDTAGVDSVPLEMVTRDSDDVWFPAASRAIAERVWDPSVEEVVFQVMLYGLEVSSLVKAIPSRRNWTPVTPRLSEAVASRETEPEIVKPEVGEVRETEGGVVSEGVAVGVGVGVDKGTGVGVGVGVGAGNTPPTERQFGMRPCS